jgi:ribosomal protein L7/L12
MLFGRKSVPKGEKTGKLDGRRIMATIIFGIAAISGVLAILVTVNQLSQRVDAANESLKKISKHLGVHEALLESLEEELKDLVEHGDKLEAIRLYRSTTGLGLEEAHEHLQELERGKRDEGLSD